MSAPKAEAMRIGIWLQPVGGHVGEGVLAEVAKRFRDQERDDRPADQEADRVDERHR